jgi:hypothetical protein
MTPLLTINQEPPDRTSIQFTEVEGEQLRSLLLQHSKLSWYNYLQRVEIAESNAANYLSGRNRISLAVLYKLISGCPSLCLNCQLSVQLQINNGDDAEDAGFIPHDEALYLTGMDYATEENHPT